MGSRSAAAVIEHLAGLVLSVDADAAGVAELEGALAELVEALAGTPSPQLELALNAQRQLQASKGAPRDALALVVKRNIEGMRGRVLIESTRGQGSATSRTTR